MGLEAGNPFLGKRKGRPLMHLALDGKQLLQTLVIDGD